MNKKYFLIICFLLVSFSVSIFASGENLNKYRVPNYNSIEEYQELVGKTITYFPQEGMYGLHVELL